MSQRDLLYFGRFFETSGYATEARSYALGLHRLGWNIRLLTLPERFACADLIDPGDLALLREMAQRSLDSPPIALLHQKPDTYPDTNCPLQIARTTFETDRIPDGWADRLNAMTEVWVPSRFNLETFAASGVEPAKLRLVRQGIDTTRFTPDAEPYPLPKERGFTFLSAFTWQDRKGWDLLLRAYLTEFGPDEDVNLIIWAQPFYRTPDEMAADVSRLVEEDLGLDPAGTAPVRIVAAPCPDSDMPGLYTACDAFVLPTRGEGWGRPFAEAMACGKPVIGTRWGGNLDFMTDANSYLIDTEGLVPVPAGVEVPGFRGHRWASPSVEHLRQLMRRVCSRPAEAAERGARARADIAAGWDLRLAVGDLSAALERVIAKGG
ncbi:MAG TPA: glycosyltransferase [Symbiobacteriaceae bacterium]|nr:glycosyltransferase [Symbiobacteriaceae bacterium]